MSSDQQPNPLVELVATATALFYLAEHEANPAIASYWDAFHYVASAVSVGHTGVQPVTPMGKMIAGMVMLVTARPPTGPLPTLSTPDRTTFPAR
jgi:hypothetical protein